MANAWYDITKTAIGNNDFDLGALTDPEIVAIEDGEYTFDQSHNFLDDIPVAARVSTQNLTNVTWGTVAESVIDADDVTFPSPGTQVVKGFVIYDNTGTESTSRLILYIDSSSGLPITLISGRDLEINWDTNGIAKL